MSKKYQSSPLSPFCTALNILRNDKRRWDSFSFHTESCSGKFPRPSLQPSHAQHEGRGLKILGLERVGEYGGRVDVSGFSREESLVCVETAHCDCHLSLITALPEDKAGHALV